MADTKGAGDVGVGAFVLLAMALRLESARAPVSKDARAAMKTGRLTVITDKVVERLDYDPATKRITGVRFIDRLTGERGRATSRIVFLNAGSFNSVHILLNSADEANPNGLANSSGVLGTHIMDHASTLSAIAVMPGFEDRTSFGNRPSGAIIPRFRNLDTMDGVGHTRGYSYQGGALQSGWSRGKREAGIGADYKSALQKPGPWRAVFVAFAECMPRVTNRLTLDKVKKDAQGLPALNIDMAFGKEESAALADAKAEVRMMKAAAI